MSNPKVRPELYFYPEDTAPRLEQTRQAEKWLHDVRCQDTTPMVRIQNTDYFIHEPAMLHDHPLPLFVASRRVDHSKIQINRENVAQLSRLIY